MRAATSPPELFAALWRQAAAWTPAERASAPAPDAGFARAAVAALQEDAADAAYVRLTALLNATYTAQMRGQVLALMRAVDDQFALVHPRGLHASPSAMLRRPTAPEWLREARDVREFTGAYAEGAQHRLIARGPLLRTDRPETANSAESFEDRFRYLQVVPTSLQQGDRLIAVSLRRLSTSVAEGVEPTPRLRREQITFVPVAETAGDLAERATQRGAALFADVRAAASLDVVARLVAAIEAAGASDIAVAPELVVDSAAADALGRRLQAAPSACRMIVAGSGASAEQADAMAWNEARVLNGLGAELWRQRKIWPAGWDQARALDLGLVDPGEAKLLFEDNQAGDEIVVADADGLGRCVILICQDLKAAPLAADLIRHYQPDWIITPILDWGVGPARWSHGAAYRLSELSQGRFLIVTSVAFAARLGRGEVDFGLALGPSEPAEDGVLSRALLTTRGDPAAQPRFAVVVWGEGAWRQTTLGAE